MYTPRQRALTLVRTGDPYAVASWGRGSRMLMLERLIDHMRGREGVRFRTIGEVVAEFRAAHPFPGGPAS